MGRFFGPNVPIVGLRDVLGRIPGRQGKIPGRTPHLRDASGFLGRFFLRDAFYVPQLPQFRPEAGSFDVFTQINHCGMYYGCRKVSRALECPVADKNTPPCGIWCLSNLSASGQNSGTHATFTGRQWVFGTIFFTGRFLRATTAPISTRGRFL